VQLDPDRQPFNPRPRPPAQGSLVARVFKRPKRMTLVMVAIVAVVHLGLGYAFVDLGKNQQVAPKWQISNIEVALCSARNPASPATPTPRLIVGGQIPKLARELNLSGTVRLQAAIDATGMPVATCLEQRGNDRLDAMMAGEVMTWRFAPPERAGVGVPSLYRAEFRLDP
jgi:hypothetical protein